jgi:nitrate reductase (NAD(P)H)
MVYRSSQVSSESSDSEPELYNEEFSEDESPTSTYTDLETPPRSESPHAKIASVDLELHLPPSLAPSTAAKLDARRQHYPYEFPALPKLHANTTISPLDKATSDNWVARDERMVRLTGKHPFNAEVSVDSLFEGGFLTPAELFYTRSHGAVPKIEGEVLKNWTLKFEGYVVFLILSFP